MGRLTERTPFYYFKSKTTGKRVGWVYPSTKAAKRAFYEENKKYIDYPDFDEYMKSVHKRYWKWAPKWWKAAKRNVEDLELCRGYLQYVEVRGKQNRSADLVAWRKEQAKELAKKQRRENARQEEDPNVGEVPRNLGDAG